MHAIHTKYLGPTNTRGSRVTATCWKTKITVAWDYSKNVLGNHEAAVASLVEKLNDERQDFPAFRWAILASGENANGKGITAIIDLVSNG